MAILSNSRRWGSIARALHWLMALGIIGNGLWGLWMTGLSPSMQKINVFALHKSIGMTLLALGLLRLAWRLVDRPPRPEAAPRWQHWLAGSVHAGLYGLILAIPLSGWWFNSASGYPLQWFKRFNLPALGSPRQDLASLALSLHQYLFWLLIALLLLHVAAALKHHYVDRDATLARMLPGLRLPSSHQESKP